jgi:prepilin-type N-terminal cleavage/methylation domain-containing protein
MSNRILGFSLLEVSVVLTVFGLIVGGVLVGKDLIESAKTRALISDINRYNSSIDTFKELYGKFPGDYEYATITLSSSAVNGDGNGYITGTRSTFQGDPYSANFSTPSSILTNVYGGTASGEFVQLFYHLYLANLTTVPFDGSYGVVKLGVNLPAMSTGSGGMLFYHSPLDYKPYWHLGIVPTTSSPTLRFKNVLTPGQAYRIDYKMDDGDPTAGKVIAVSTIDAIYSDVSTALSCCGADQCFYSTGDISSSSTAARLYYINNPLGACQLRIGAN